MRREDRAAPKRGAHGRRGEEGTRAGPAAQWEKIAALFIKDDVGLHGVAV